MPPREASLLVGQRASGRGVATKTPERVAEAIRLREVEGLEYAEIAARLGIARSTAFAWCSDPDGSKLKARKDIYRGECDLCGGATNGSAGPGRGPTRCQECITWTRDAALAALRDWFDEHGDPPREAQAVGSGRLPVQGTLQRLFGGWNAALLAAGIPLVCDRRESTWSDVRQRFLAGASVTELAAERGCAKQNIYNHLRLHGISRPSGSSGSRWSREQIIDAMRRWDREHGQPPGSADWLRAPDGYPSYSTVRRRFGSWGDALAAAFDFDQEEVADAA